MCIYVEEEFGTAAFNIILSTRTRLHNFAPFRVVEVGLPSPVRISVSPVRVPLSTNGHPHGLLEDPLDVGAAAALGARLHVAVDALVAHKPPDLLGRHLKKERDTEDVAN